ncbi:MAG: GNAT family N-acetyltransferase [Verrucomicrobiaceae bacterium]|nr:MAG: GNAT family N-acetyltransferase [Verrucomicrobiaceae bacterium]
MPDLLVRLYDLPPLESAVERVAAAGFQIRRALAPEKHVILPWIEEVFSPAWASECEVAFSRLPLACFVATQEQKLCGFSAYEATCRNFFGPLGVTEEYRCEGLGIALLLSGLHAMRNEGYAYAIIGGAGPVDFFEKAVSAVPIEHSTPGLYQGLLRMR